MSERWLCERVNTEQHTPFPWVFSGYAVRSETGDTIAHVGDYPSDQQRTLRNARLLAASGYLLGALKGMVDVFDGPGGTESPACAAAREAIAKATS